MPSKFVVPLEPDKWATVGGLQTQQLAGRETGQPFCRLAIQKIPAGGSGPGLHINEHDQFYYVISGTMSVEVGGQTQTAGPNCVVVVPGGMPHRIWNEGGEEETHISLAVPEPEASAVVNRGVTVGGSVSGRS